MKIAVGHTIFEKPLSLTHYVFLQTIVGSKEPEHGLIVPWGDEI